MSMARIVPALDHYDLSRSVDGSKALNPKIESIARMLAAQELTNVSIAARARVSLSTVKRVKAHTVVKARVAYLREALVSSAYADAPLVDKRNRVVMAAALAEALHDEGTRKEWRETLAVTKTGHEITGFDWRRTDQVRQLLDYIAKEVGDRTAPPASSTTVNVGISMDDAVTRVRALLSRVATPEAERTATPVAVPEGVAGGGAGTNADVSGVRLLTEYKEPLPREAMEYENSSHAGALEGEYEDVE